MPKSRIRDWFHLTLKNQQSINATSEDDTIKELAILFSEVIEEKYIRWDWNSLSSFQNPLS